MYLLAVGDLVYSIHREQIVAVPIRQVNRVPVHAHHVVRVFLDTGAVLEISTGHPTVDGRTFGELGVGDALDDATIVSLALVPYLHEHTYDILPDSETGAYFASGVAIGSTLHGWRGE